MVARQSSDGHRYYVAEPILPRIRDEYLDCVVYLYPTKAEAEDGARAGGSGFLVGVPSVGLRRNFWFLYAVTNKHVIDHTEKSPASTVLRMNTRAGKTTVMPTARRSWETHPDGDDLAACVISFDPMAIKFNHVPRGNFLTKDIVKKFNIGPGDDAFMVGRFVNHEGKQSNLPTVRFGNVAQMPYEPVSIDGVEQEAFLVEVRSIGGFSGSPIFISIPPFSERDGVDDWYPPTVFIKGKRPPENFDYGFLSKHGPWLLGIDYAYMNNWSPVCKEDGEPVRPTNPASLQVAANTGMAAVIPAWKLAELLDSGPLAQHRKEVEREVMEYEAKNPPVATLTGIERLNDTGGVSRPSDEANPTHREDFMSLLNAAAKTRPQGDQTSRDGNGGGSDDS
jgi:hypothetical protein